MSGSWPVAGHVRKTTTGLKEFLIWLTGCTHVAGVYWQPVWNILSDGAFELALANAAHIKNAPAAQDGYERRDVVAG